MQREVAMVEKKKFVIYSHNHQQSSSTIIIIAIIAIFITVITIIIKRTSNRSQIAVGILPNEMSFKNTSAALSYGRTWSGVSTSEPSSRTNCRAQPCACKLIIITGMRVSRRAAASVTFISGPGTVFAKALLLLLLLMLFSLLLAVVATAVAAPLLLPLQPPLP